MARKIDSSEIEKQAKEILDKFAKALEKIEKEHDLDFHVDREESDRVEKNSQSCEVFKELLLENAPKKNKDFIIAEKASW